jgi:hypothetical protein
MSIEIGPLRRDELDPLSRFLAAGFGAPADARFAAPDVLRWKFLDPGPFDAEVGAVRSWVARGGNGALVGHVGIWPTRFTIAGPDGPPRRVGTLHLLDWLGDRRHPGVGARLMRRVHELTPTQYAFGGTEAGRAVVARAGYLPCPAVPVLRRVLKPLVPPGREPGDSLARRLGRWGRDLGRAVADRPARASVGVELRPVARFGREVDELVEGLRAPLAFTGRTAVELNRLLDYPHGGLEGRLIQAEDRSIGFTVLGRAHAGRAKVAELFLDRFDVHTWHAAGLAVARELRRMGAREAVACASTPWALHGLRLAGFRHAYDLDFSIRDPEGLLPRDVPYHLGFVEADYATLP